MTKTAVVAGVGAGLGAALVRKFAREGYQVGMMARSQSFMQTLASEMEAEGHRALPMPTDLTESEQVTRSFAQIKEELGPVDVLINHAGNAAWKDFMELTLNDLEQAWRICVGGSFLCSQAVIGDMVERGDGAILFTGATSSIRGRADGLAFSSAKFAVRGLAESLAKKFWPQGVHVAHIIIDGWLATQEVRKQNPDAADTPMLDVDHVAASYWALTEQERGGWSFEIEMRPYNEEEFFG